MRPAIVPLLAALTAAGCSGTLSERSPSGLGLAANRRAAPSCRGGSTQSLQTRRVAYAAAVQTSAVAYRRPGGLPLATFGRFNANEYPTVFGVLAAVVNRHCGAVWYRVQLPLRPNGMTGYVRAGAVSLEEVRARIVVDVSDRRLTLLRDGRAVLRAAVAVGASATPTPTGRFYVNQRLIPADRLGPYGPGALGISAFSDVLTGWAQGGPVAIHGTNEPWSIGRAVSNGCVRLSNAVLERVFAAAPAGTPVLIRS